MPDHIKSINLGILLMNVVGPHCLTSAVDLIKDEQQKTGSDPAVRWKRARTKATVEEITPEAE